VIDKGLSRRGTPELEEANNTAQAATYIGYQARLPIIHR